MDSEFLTKTKEPIIGSKVKLNQHNNEVGRQVILLKNNKN